MGNKSNAQRIEESFKSQRDREKKRHLEHRELLRRRQREPIEVRTVALQKGELE